jgi:hypothetical protein
MLLINFSLLSFPSPNKQRKINDFTTVNWLIVIISLLMLLSRFSCFPCPSLGKRRKTDDFTPVNWLVDLLPTEIPEARIMTFNYLSRWHRNAPHQDRRAPSDILLEHLHMNRERVWKPSRVLITMDLKKSLGKNSHPPSYLHWPQLRWECDRAGMLLLVVFNKRCL